MRVLGWLLVILVGLPSCRSSERAPAPRFPLLELRRSFKTVLPDAQEEERVPAPAPPEEIFELVRYPAPLGMNAAYVSPVRKGPKRPAIIWISGGFDWGIDESWYQSPRKNDQSARAFREAGIVLMRPSLRGTNDSPGRREYFLGEVDDVLAAAEFLAKREDVDPTRIYLGGHSTGGTMALLAAESTNRFRAVFSFGPVADVGIYADDLTDGPSGEAEFAVRSPGKFLNSIVTPTFVIEGTEGNIGWFHWMRQNSKSAPVQFVPLFGLDHFNILAPMTEYLARKIHADTGDAPIHLEDAELDELVTSMSD